MSEKELLIPPDTNVDTYHLLPVSGTNNHVYYSIIGPYKGAVVKGDVTFDEMELAMSFLYQMRNGSTWGIVDLIRIAKELWGDAYTQLIELTQMSPNTIYNLNQVGKHFPTIETRHWNLSPSHYQEVSRNYLSLAQKAELLDEAVLKGMTRDELRQLVSDRYGPAITDKTSSFSKEAFVTRIKHLLKWAEENNAPPDLIRAVDMLLKQFVKEEFDFDG